MTIHKGIVFSGLIAFVLLWFTAFAGLMHISYYGHIFLGIATLVFSCLHVVLIYYRKWCLRKRKEIR